MTTFIRNSFLVALVSFFFLIHAQVSHAKLIINEFSSSTADDWVEIYNTGDQDEPLSGYRLRDGTATNSLELNGILAPKGHIFFSWGNTLNKDGDIIRLVDRDDETKEMDHVVYGNLPDKDVDAPGLNQIAARTTDGGDDWALFLSATKGEENVNATPAPTSTPIPTETPKPTPTVTKSPTATKSPTKEPTDLPPSLQAVQGSTTRKPTPTVDYQVPTAVLVDRTRQHSPVPTKVQPSPQVKTKGLRAVSPSVIMILVGMLVVLSCLGFGYHAYRNGRL